MRLEPTLNITPEGSLTDIPTVMEREALGTSSETAYMDFPNTQVKTRLKESERPTTLCGTKETSQAEVLASTRKFFVNIPDGDQRIRPDVYVRNNVTVMEVPTMTIVTTTTSTPTSLTMVDTDLRGTGSPRISLPERTVPRPTVTVTCRPRTWMQQLTEGQTTEPSRERDSSNESHETLEEQSPEEIPDELGHEWRVLHPFDLSGVRFPTDTTPSNQRQLAENDALVELIQTTEYLDDVPTWGHRDYRLYPPHYRDPFYRGRGRGNRGRREWLQERLVERSNGDCNRGNGQDNDVRPQITISTSVLQIYRQDDEWSVLPITDRREVMERQQITQASPPAAPPPTEERLFTEWSSEDSPRERANQQLQSVRSTESRGIPSQTEQTERVSRDAREVRHVPESVMTGSSTQEQMNQVGTRITEHEPNTAVVQIRLTRDEEIIHSHNQGVKVPLPNGGTSSRSTHTEESIERTIMPNIMP